MSLAMEPMSKLQVENSVITSWEASRDFDQKRTFGNTFRRVPRGKRLCQTSVNLTKFSELQAQRENDLSEVVEYIYYVGSLSKDWPSRFLEEEAKKDERL